MSTRNDRLNASMRSLDELTASFEAPSKANVFSDKGQGVERLLDEIDHSLGQRASCPLRGTLCGQDASSCRPVYAKGTSPLRGMSHANREAFHGGR